MPVQVKLPEACLIGYCIDTANFIIHRIVRGRPVGGVDLQVLEQRIDARQTVEQGPVTDLSRGDGARKKDHVCHDARPGRAARAAQCPAPSWPRRGAVLMLVPVMSPPYAAVISPHALALA